MPNSNKKTKSTPKTPTPKVSKGEVRNAVISALKDLPKGTLANVGSALGGRLGGPIGAVAGRAAGTVMSRITGVGSYTIQNGTKIEGSPPSFARQGEKVILAHREYIGSLVSPGTGFNNTPYNINPGDTNTFPWLASVARNFQRYRFKGLVYEYKSKSTDFATGSSLGTVSIGTNYNSFDAPWTTFQQVQNASFTVDGKPSESFYHLVECARSMGGGAALYVRDGTNAVNAPQLYDVGLLQVCTNGITAAVGTELGSLWCTYEIELMEPIVGLVPSLTSGGWYSNSINTAQTGFGCGPLFSNVTDGATWLSTVANTSLSGQLLTSAIQPCFAPPSTFPAGCFILVNYGAVTKTATSGSVTYYFNRNANYLITYHLGATTGGATIPIPWTFSGNGAVASVVNNSTLQTSTTATGYVRISVVGAIGGFVPFITATANSTQTCTNSSISISVVS